MKIERSITSGTLIMLMLGMLAGCGNEEQGKTAKLTNPTCEDLGKIEDPVEHAALHAKCPDYMRWGAKKSPSKEW